MTQPTHLPSLLIANYALQYSLTNAHKKKKHQVNGNQIETFLTFSQPTKKKSSGFLFQRGTSYLETKKKGKKEKEKKEERYHHIEVAKHCPFVLHILAQKQDIGLL